MPDKEVSPEIVILAVENALLRQREASLVAVCERLLEWIKTGLSPDNRTSATFWVTIRQMEALLEAAVGPLENNHD